MSRPEGCYRKPELPKALGIGYERFYVLMDDYGFVEPDGYYKGNPPACKEFPYWHIDTAKKWLDAINDGSITKTDHADHVENKTPWAVPAYDRNESIVSIRTQIFLRLMSVPA